MRAEEILIKNGKPISGLAPNHPLRTFSLGERIRGGRCLLRIHGLVSPEDAAALRDECLAAADERKKGLVPAGDDGEVFLEQGSASKVFVRLLTEATAEREGAPEDRLPIQASDKIDRILEKAFRFLDREACPSLRRELFGDDDPSIEGLFRDNLLDYSIREPAVNVYEAPHGRFAMHKDHHALSILVPLSDPTTNFSGGGTAFWSQSHPVEGMDPPAVVLKPTAGTAMLWGGRVSHKGMRITSGTRVVLVASFSGPGSPRENVRDRLSAGLGVRTILSGR